MATSAQDGKPCRAERERVIAAQLCCSISQPLSLGDLLGKIYNPATRLPLGVAPSGHAIGRGEVRIDFDGTIKVRQCLAVCLPAPLVYGRQTSQVIVIGVEALSRLRFARSISAFSNLGAMAPTTLA